MEEEQGGSAKSTYGDRLLPELSRALTAEFGKGFSYANLRNFRQFYLTYPQMEICYTLCSKLTWSHNRLIMREEKPESREYYLRQVSRENWSVRQLQRQIETRSYQRLLSTQDTACAPISPQAAPSIRDFIKDPYVLEFLGLPENPAASVTEVETAIISNRPQRQRTTLRLQIPHRPPHRGRTHRRTRTRTPGRRTETERRRQMNRSMSKTCLHILSLSL